MILKVSMMKSIGQAAAQALRTRGDAEKVQLPPVPGNPAAGMKWNVTYVAN
jgi:hypothetical protein